MVNNAVVNDGRRERRPPSRFDGLASAIDRGVEWVVEASPGIRVWLAILLLLAAMGVLFAPVDLYDRWQARTLAGDGEWVSAEQVQVHVSVVRGRGGGYSEVDGVRVGLEQWVELENVNAVMRPIYEGVPTGWQDPTDVTGYEPPVEVILDRTADGGVRLAMAREDFEYWTESNTDPETGVSIAVVASLLAVVSLVANKRRLDARARRGANGGGR